MTVFLLKPILFYTFDESCIQIREGETIWVDPKTLVGFFEGFHFDVSEDEYKVLQ